MDWRGLLTLRLLDWWVPATAVLALIVSLLSALASGRRARRAETLANEALALGQAQAAAQDAERAAGRAAPAIASQWQAELFALQAAALPSEPVVTLVKPDTLEGAKALESLLHRKEELGIVQAFAREGSISIQAYTHDWLQRSGRRIAPP